LAEAHGERAISIVLSGSGSDEAVGIGRIKECGGITLVQSPEDAEYGEMPANAMATGQVDIVLPIADIPQKLIELSANARSITLPSAGDESTTTAADRAEAETLSAEHALQRILKALRARTGHDFRHYKRATVLRRIERRLQVNGLPDLQAYQRFVGTHPDETGALLRDMLIGVTNFFRDREAFEAVEREVVPDIFASKAEADPLRVWVAGCSTGEEAYSLAMLFSENKAEGTGLAKLQIFATDLDQQAIEIARTGSYPESIIADIPPSRLRRFFTLVRGRDVINKALRESVLFAAHNVLRDPPFSHLDLVSCRNLMIYLDRTVQRQVLETFHFALRPGGLLFLGSSESVDIADDLFSTVDKKNRIYRARTLPAKVPLISSPAVTGNQALAPRTLAPAPMRDSASMTFASLHQQAIERYAPPSVLVDRNAEILHMSDDVGRFLRYVGGEPSHNLLTLINPDLGLELRTALFQALQNGRSVDAERVRFSHGATHSYVNMTVRRFSDATNSAVFCTIFFDETDETTRPDEAAQNIADQNPLVAHLEGELHRTKELLRLSIEQSNASNEELKASNEELQAINEEMRSATEELETSKEELQSVNEELVTVNSALQVKVEETAKANDDHARHIPLVKDAAEAIQRSVIGQAKIIDDLLDLSRVRTGKLALNFTDVDLAAVIRSVKEACASDAEKGGIALTTSRTDTALVIQADSVRVEQMLWNLLRNALKFTPRGGSVSVALSEDNRFACIEVKDSGKGIAPEFLPKVFDMFSQAEASVKRDSSGLGIGLSLTKQLAEMHGGRIEGESAGVGLGACFRLWLPKSSPFAVRSKTMGVADASVLKGLRILLVDDSLESLEAFGALLELEGAEVTAESSAQKALARAANALFDLILSDIAMPDMSGYELIEALRKQPNTAKVPVIALTGFGRDQDAARALRAGFDAHIGEPVTLSGLLGVLGANVPGTRNGR
jgi:chemotaxis methyl-accepting protein methylase/CheY-like chemotaxis protein